MPSKVAEPVVYFALFFLNIRIFIWLRQVLVAAHGTFFFLIVACELLVKACRIQFPDHRSDSGPSALGVGSLSHWTTREVPPMMYFLIFVLFPNPEHDDRVSFPQRRKKGRGPFRWKSGEGNRRSGRGGSSVRSSRLEDDDRDVAMSDVQDAPRVR